MLSVRCTYESQYFFLRIASSQVLKLQLDIVCEFVQQQQFPVSHKSELFALKYTARYLNSWSICRFIAATNIVQSQYLRFKCRHPKGVNSCCVLICTDQRTSLWHARDEHGLSFFCISRNEDRAVRSIPFGPHLHTAQWFLPVFSP